MTTPDELSGLVDEILPDVVRIRHTLHQHPELALQEHETAALVRSTLESLGMRLRDPLLGTDVIGILGDETTGKHVALRADMDALPLQEKTGVPYSSKCDSIMHACGHDGHTAGLLGAGGGEVKGADSGLLRDSMEHVGEARSARVGRAFLVTV